MTRVTLTALVVVAVICSATSAAAFSLKPSKKSVKQNKRAPVDVSAHNNQVNYMPQLAHSLKRGGL